MSKELSQVAENGAEMFAAQAAEFVHETLTPYFTILPFGTAMFIALIGLVPTFVILVKASNSNKSITSSQTIFASVAALVGAWGFLNAATLLLNV